MKKLIPALLLLTWGMITPASAIPVLLVTDTETYLKRSDQIFIVRCLAVPEQQSPPAEDELTPSEAEVKVLMSLKGDVKTGKRSVKTVYRLTPGETYLISSYAGFAADLSAVLIYPDFDLDLLKGKTTKQQAQMIFSRHLYAVQRDLAFIGQRDALLPPNHDLLKLQQRCLTECLADRTDDQFQSNGPVKISKIKKITLEAPILKLNLPLDEGELPWTNRNHEKSGHFYFQTASAKHPQWEFAYCGKSLKELNGKLLTAKFYGRYSPDRDRRLGAPDSEGVPIVNGEVILIRSVTKPDTVYLLQVDQQTGGVFKARYAIVER